MTLKEFRKAVAESPDVEFYQNLKLELNYPHINFHASFEGVVGVYEFILTQLKGYEKLQGLPKELNDVKEVFGRVKDAIVELFNSNNQNESTWKNNLDLLTRVNPLMFLYESPETEFLINVYKDRHRNYLGAYEFFTGNANRITNKEHFIGYMIAYEFTSKEFSVIAERKNIERKSIASIRNDFQTNLNQAENQLIEYLAGAKEKSAENSIAIDKFRNDKEKEFYQWYDVAVENIETFNSNSSQKIKDFEELYKEKIKLEAPAKYWSERAEKLRSEGNRWLTALIIAVLIGVGLLIWCLSEISAGTLDKIFQNNGTAIKWSVVFITLISFIAFAIRIFSKLTFSSYHLVRDAEEREQLTYVYLALKKEKNIDETERHLIMQSLFSRADSGLLKDDSGPTMPGNIIDQVTKR